MKKCRKCLKNKSDSEFYLHSTTKDRRGTECIKCVKLRITQYERANPERKFGKNLKRKYWKNCRWQDALGQYRKLLSQQRGVCAICKQPEKKILRGKIRTLSVDHCHATGKVRALLCDSCNVAEGLLKTPRVAEALAKYMRKHA